MTSIYMIDRNDDASALLHEWVRSERNVLNRDVIHIEARKSLAETMNTVILEGTDVDVFVPSLWTDTGKGTAWSKDDVKMIKDVFASRGITVRFTFPFVNLQLSDVLKRHEDYDTGVNLNGACEHHEVEGEQCGICPHCIEKFLACRLHGIPTEESFMEDPLTGYGSAQRLSQILARLSQNQFGRANAPSKSDVAIGSLLVKCFFEGLLPADLCLSMEKHHQVLLTETA